MTFLMHKQHEIATEAQRLSLKISVRSVKICASVAKKMFFQKSDSQMNQFTFSNNCSLSQAKSSLSMDYSLRLCVSA